jgi:ATP phosphoribosyltransferase
MTFRLLQLAGYEVQRVSDRSYHPKIVNAPDLTLFMARAQELPLFVEQGILDAALTGMDLVEDASVSIRDVADLGYNKLGLGSVTLALAIPHNMTLTSLKELEEKRIATAYQNLTQKFFRERGITVQILPSAGATEGKVPLIADAIVDLVETGATLEAHQLKPILSLYKTTVHLIVNNSSWGYTWKRRRLEEIGSKLEEAAQKLPQNPKRRIELSDMASKARI